MSGRKQIHALQVDDIVFHYGNGALRAVSNVAATAVETLRPAEHMIDLPDGTPADSGWLVRLHTEELPTPVPLATVRERLRWGEESPLDRNGVPAQKFLSALTLAEAGVVLSALDADDPSSDDAVGDSDNLDRATSAEISTLQRLEQRALRRYLLAGRAHAPCAICGRNFPAAVLVAAHIERRSELENQRRWDFRRIAALMCRLGCDALFEEGYVAVGHEGRVVSARPSKFADLDGEISIRVDRVSMAWNELTAPAFEGHLKKSMSEQAAGEISFGA